MERKHLYSLAFLLLAIAQSVGTNGAASASFARTSGTRFVMNGRPFYTNGFNAYWLMYIASDPAERGKVSSAFQQASIYGMNLARTWAFSDGGYRPLQISPGVYNEDMFKVSAGFALKPLRTGFGTIHIRRAVNESDSEEAGSDGLSRQISSL